MLKINHISFGNIFHADLEIDKKFFNKIKKHSITKHRDLKTTFYEDLPQDLRDQIINYLNTYITEVGKCLKKKSHVFKKIWIQKYGIADYHNLHIHEVKKNSYSFILYIDGGYKSGKTKFYNLGYPYIYYDYYLEMPPVAGKCVVFFGALPHESVPSRDNKKIVVSGNIEYS